MYRGRLRNHTKAGHVAGSSNVNTDILNEDHQLNPADNIMNNQDSYLDNATGKEYICVECGGAAAALVHKYSQSVIALCKCKKCGQTVDKYVEQDSVLVLLDLLLHKLGAFRHLLHNIDNWQPKYTLRVCVIFILCDAYYKWIDRPRTAQQDQQQYFELEWRFYKCVVHSLMDLLVFSGSMVLLLAAFDYPTFVYVVTDCRRRCTLVHGLVLGMFVVWQLHLTLSYVLITRFFIFTSNVQILRAVCSGSDLSWWRSVTVLIGACAIQYLVSHAFYIQHYSY